MPSQYLWAACHRTSLKQGPSPRHHSPLPLSSASSCRDSPPTALPKPCLPGPSRSPGVPRRQAVFGKPSNFSGARPPSPPKPIHCCVCPQRPLRESALVFIFPPAAPRTSVRLGSSFFLASICIPGLRCSRCSRCCTSLWLTSRTRRLASSSVLRPAARRLLSLRRCIFFCPSASPNLPVCRVQSPTAKTFFASTVDCDYLSRHSPVSSLLTGSVPRSPRPPAEVPCLLVAHGPRTAPSLSDNIVCCYDSRGALYAVVVCGSFIMDTEDGHIFIRVRFSVTGSAGDAR
jgi:hypothetical protein